MKREAVKEVIACLGNDRKIFHYFKDRYCLDMIEFEMNRRGVDSLLVHELKSGSLRQFVQKPIVAEALKQCGGGKLGGYELDLVRPIQQIPFVLTLANWGEEGSDWDQTTRNQCNLVLQLNFDGGHVGEYNRRINPDDSYGPFEFWGHPVVEEQRKTLSWIRMDIDLDSGEVLIEEIQNDWLRFAQRAFQRVKYRRSKSPSIKPKDVIDEIKGNYEDLEHYVERTLKPYREIWAEASMLAAIKFIREELGITSIYYHSFDTGKRIKKVCGSPPRSMYTQLPKKFGFELTDQAPEFLQRDKYSRRCIKAIKAPRWYRLN